MLQLSEQSQRRARGSSQRAAPDPSGSSLSCCRCTSCPPSSPTTWRASSAISVSPTGFDYLSFSCSKAPVSDISSSARLTLFLRLASLSFLVRISVVLINDQTTSLRYSGRRMHSSQSWSVRQWWPSCISCWPQTLHTETQWCRRTCCPAGPSPPHPCWVPCLNHFCSRGYAPPSFCRVPMKSSERRRTRFSGLVENKDA